MLLFEQKDMLFLSNFGSNIYGSIYCTWIAVGIHFSDSQEFWWFSKVLIFGILFHCKYIYLYFSLIKDLTPDFTILSKFSFRQKKKSLHANFYARICDNNTLKSSKFGHLPKLDILFFYPFHSRFHQNE